MPIFSILTGEERISSSILEAETTTSCPKIVFSFNSMSYRKEVSWFTLTSFSCVSYPTIENTKVNGGGVLVINVKFPFTSEIVPISLFLMVIFTPIKGCPEPSSEILPLTETWLCPIADPMDINKSKEKIIQPE